MVGAINGAEGVKNEAEQSTMKLVEPEMVLRCRIATIRLLIRVEGCGDEADGDALSRFSPRSNL